MIVRHLKLRAEAAAADLYTPGLFDYCSEHYQSIIVRKLNKSDSECDLNTRIDRISVYRSLRVRGGRVAQLGCAVHGHVPLSRPPIAKRGDKMAIGEQNLTGTAVLSGKSGILLATVYPC